MNSDIGSKFLGADREFKEYVAAWNQERVEEPWIEQGIKRKFNPAAAPHVGGVWERLVKSCKRQPMQS